MVHRIVKKQAYINRIQLSKEFQDKWSENFGKKREVPESSALVEQPAPPNINHNAGSKAAESGSQELASSIAPNRPAEKYASKLPAEDNPPLLNINKDSRKETKSSSLCSQELTRTTADIPPSKEDTEMLDSNMTEREIINLSSYPAQNPSNTRAAAAVLERKALSNIVSRPKVTEKSWTVTDWVPQKDNIHPSSEELEADLTFESLYNIIPQCDGSPLSSPNDRRLPVFKEIYQTKELPPLPNTKDTTGRETESSSHDSQESTISSVPNETVKHFTSSDALYEKEVPPVLQEENPALVERHPLQSSISWLHPERGHENIPIMFGNLPSQGAPPPLHGGSRLVTDLLECCRELDEGYRAWAAHKMAAASRLKMVELKLESDKRCRRKEKMDEIEAKVKALKEEHKASLDRIEAEYREQLARSRKDAEAEEQELDDQWAAKHSLLAKFLEQMESKSHSSQLSTISSVPNETIKHSTSPDALYEKEFPPLLQEENPAPVERQPLPSSISWLHLERSCEKKQ